MFADSSVNRKEAGSQSDNGGGRGVERQTGICTTVRYTSEQQSVLFLHYSARLSSLGAFEFHVVKRVGSEGMRKMK